jgi:dTDP-4-amino-4,6-dideoxygalactose transaminase
MTWKIPLFKIYYDAKDIKAVTNVIQRGTYWSTGPEIKDLEQHIATYVNIKYACAFNSGTSALHALLLACNVKKGDEVIIPSFTFIATANTVVLTGAKPVFAEIEDQSYGLDAKDVAEKINQKTKAIIPIHYGGAPCKEILALRDLAEDHNILLIEDAAESLGSKINNNMVGTIGQAAMFSFCQNKVITAGEGGLVVTDDKDIHKRLTLIRSHGRLEMQQDYFSTTGELDYILAGYNYRMSSISAALVLSQFKKIKQIINMRRKRAHYYKYKLLKIHDLKIPIEIKNHYHIYQMYTIQLKNKKTRDELQEYLKKEGIMTKIYFQPIHLKTFYKREYNYCRGDFPITEEIAGRVLTLPIYPTITNKEIDYITKTIREWYE